MLGVLIYGTASAAHASETGGGWGTEEVHSYIRSLLKSEETRQEEEDDCACISETDRQSDRGIKKAIDRQRVTF